GEPLAPVQTDMERERKPTLEPRVHEADARVEEVVVVVETLAAGRYQHEPTRRAVAMDFVAPAALDGFQRADEARGDPVALRDGAGHRFLRLIRACQIDEGALGRGGHGFGRLLDTGRRLLHIVTELGERYVGVPQEPSHALD